MIVNRTVCRMGRRKLRFSARKNYERKRYVKHKLPVVPEADEGEVVQDVSPVLQEVLKVSIPLSLYREAVAPDISTLHSRLQHSGVLPAPWICSMVSGTTLVLNKFGISSPHTSAEVIFLLTISSNFAWVLCVRQKQVNIRQCQVLSHISDKLCCTGDMLRVMTVLDNSTLCVGNPDNKFDYLIEHYKRGFTDASGKSDFAKIAIICIM